MSKHGKDDSVTHNASGDVTNMRGTITEAPGTRPYAPRPETTPKHAKK